MEISSFGTSRGVVFQDGSRILESEMVDTLCAQFSHGIPSSEIANMVGEFFDAHQERHFVYRPVGRRKAA